MDQMAITKSNKDLIRVAALIPTPIATANMV